MLRRLFLLPLLVALAIGCSKKKSDEDAGPGGNVDPVPTGQEYTLNLREEQAGDKSVVTETTKGLMSTTVTGPKGKQANSKIGIEKFEYTETIHEFPAGADHPTKVTRAYKFAEEGEEGKAAKPATYAGKTVLIEKKNGRYSITADGKPLPADEDAKFRKSFEKPGLKQTMMLPKKPVKVNETWTLDPAVLTHFSEDMKLPLNREKSSATGKLLKVETKDGKPWGTIELAINFRIEGGGAAKFDGDMAFTGTVHAPIDGSAHEGTMTMKMAGKITGKGPGGEMETAMDVNGVETRTPVK